MFVNKVDRPKKFEDYIGQDNIIANLRIYIASSKKQAKVLDHIIIHGPSGMGKTSLANLISLEMKKRIIILNGPTLQKPSDIISPLTTLKQDEFLFIDEVHAVSKEVLEVIYPVLENNELSVILGKDYNSKIVNIKLQPFTLICATTEINKLPLPFVNRFSINFQLQPYSRNDITKIIINYAKNINFELKYEIANFIARFTKNNPRIAINIIKRIYDYYIIENPAEVSITYIKSILQKLQIWKFGLSNIDVRYLKILAQHGTLGIDSISQILDLPVTIIINTIEPALVKNVLIVKSSKGRTITDEGRKFLNSMAIDK
jgi:Holliday junction DNA helicase RuvB